MAGLTWLGQLFWSVCGLDVQAVYFRQEAVELNPRDRKPLE